MFKWVTILFMNILGICIGWHNLDNSRFHCWPANASWTLTDTFAQYGHNCRGSFCLDNEYEEVYRLFVGVDLHWIKEPPKQGLKNEEIKFVFIFFSCNFV